MIPVCVETVETELDEELEDETVDTVETVETELDEVLLDEELETVLTEVVLVEEVVLVVVVDAAPTSSQPRSKAADVGRVV